MPNRYLAAALAALLLHSTDAAADSDQPTISFNGFGTLGVVHSNEHDGDFTFDNLQRSGAGRTREWSMDVDSRLGLQMTANLTDRLSSVVQVVSEFRSDGSYQPYVNWANVKYMATPDLSVRVGRIALASYMASDSRKVGYSNVYMRPPTELYRILALNNSDGIDVAYRTQIGTATNTVSAIYGRKTVKNIRGIDVDSTHVEGIFDTLEHGPLTLHLAFQNRTVDNQSPPVGHFMSFGASYDPGPWFLSGEWVRVSNFDGKAVLAVREAWDVNAGCRIGQFTPFVIHSELSPRTRITGDQVAQKTTSLGVRWDFHPNYDLKVQFDQIRLGTNSPGTLQNIQKGLAKGGTVNLIGMALDFIF